jgi:hypothetical protein
MTWETFYLICFLAGLMLSVVSLLGGMGGHTHLPHVAHMPHAGHLPQGGAGHPAASGTEAGTAVLPWWNAFSIMIFLCWFGAAGYLCTRYGSLMAGGVLVVAGICGLAGGAIVFYFLAKVMLPHERELTADETNVVGAVGRVSAAIRAGGTGEMVYEQLGALRSVPARTEDGEPIEKEEEVFVIRYERGIAYVRRWDDVSEGRE